jgi:hypothetical protein
MKPSKSKPKSILPSLVRPLGSLLRRPGRPILLGGSIGAACLLGWYLTWCEVGGHVLACGDYRVTPQEVEITKLPSWIHTDIRAEVFRNASLDGPLSIMDGNLTERMATAFSLHPWVAKVRRVTKYHPARVKVELEYRRPVLMVEVPGGLLPVDARGALLPSGDFSPVEKSRFPRLVGGETLPLGTTGESWGEARVVGAAEIAALLAPAWEELRLAQIIPYAGSSVGGPDEIAYVLTTRGGTRIIWGSAPGARAAGEPSPAEKLAALQQQVAADGTLEGRDGPQELDLRSRRPTP